MFWLCIPSPDMLRGLVKDELVGWGRTGGGPILCGVFFWLDTVGEVIFGFVMVGGAITRGEAICGAICECAIDGGAIGCGACA
jgi:hypothetical protein